MGALGPPGSFATGLSFNLQRDAERLTNGQRLDIVIAAHAVPRLEIMLPTGPKVASQFPLLGPTYVIPNLSNPKFSRAPDQILTSFSSTFV